MAVVISNFAPKQIASALELQIWEGCGCVVALRESFRDIAIGVSSESCMYTYCNNCIPFPNLVACNSAWPSLKASVWSQLQYNILRARTITLIRAPDNTHKHKHGHTHLFINVFTSVRRAHAHTNISALRHSPTPNSRPTFTLHATHARTLEMIAR